MAKKKKSKKEKGGSAASSAVSRKSAAPRSSGAASRRTSAPRKYSAASGSAAAPRGIPAAAGVLCAVLLFMMTGLGNAEAIKGCAMAASIAAIAVGAMRFRTLRDRIRLPFLALFLLVLMNGIAALYAMAPKFALTEFLQILIAFDAALMLTALAPAGKSPAAAGRGQSGGAAPVPASGYWMASVVEGAGALLAIVNIDLLSTRWISGAVLSLLRPFTSMYREAPGVEPGVRLTSMFGSPNAFAGMMGLMILLSLGLIASTGRGAQGSQGAQAPCFPGRAFHIACLAAESLVFVLAFSMGAAAMLAVAFLLYLLLERKERRVPQLILMLETLVVTVAAAALAAPSALRTWEGMRPVPLLCLCGSAAALLLLDLFAGVRLENRFDGRNRLAAGCLAGLLALGGLFVFAALHMTGSVSLQAGESLERSIYPQAGEYTLQVDADAPLQISIASRNEAETLMHTRTQLYAGEADGAHFTVPEGSRVADLQFTAEEAGKIRSVSYVSAGDAGEVPLDYRLLPDYMANRIQGLRYNENAVQRLVFFRDGMKLFARSPVIGLGPGGFESGIKSVQSFYYETKYAHSHYIQTMVETGLIGLLLFLFLLVISAAAVLADRFGGISRGKGRGTSVNEPAAAGHSLTPALGAALFMMAGHAAVDVDFSHYCFLPAAYCVFALLSVCCGGALPGALSLTAKPEGSGGGRRAGGRKAFTAVVCAMLVFVLLWTGLLGMNLRAAVLVRNGLSYDALSRAAAMDRFDRSDYLVSYIYYASTEGGDEAVMEQAAEYAEQLKKLDSNSIPLYLAEYYFRVQQREEGFAMIEKYLDYCASDPKAWQKAFRALMENDDGSPEFRAFAVSMEEKMENWQANNLGTIELEGDVEKYLREAS